MAFYDTTWYCNAGDQSTTGHYAVAKRPQNAAVAAGQLVRQFTAPAVGSERVFICIVAGTTANVTDATWVLTRGAKTTDGTATWMEVTGMSAVNGDAVNTPTWAQAKAINVPSLGAIIKRNSGTSYQICTTAGSMAASEPAFSDTAGAITADGTSVWTSLGVVGNFTGGAAPHARLNNAFATSWWAAGHTIYVGDNHVESQATAITIAPSLTTTTISRVLCHNRSGSYPPTTNDLRTTATISTSAAANINLSWTNGTFYIYGIAFKVGVGQAGNCSIFLSTINAWSYFDNCSLQIATTFAGQSTISFGSTNNVCTFVLNNTTMYFGSTSQRVDLNQVQFIWQNTGQVLAAGSVVPTVLMISSSAGQQRSLVLEALDLSQLTGTLVAASGGSTMGNTVIKDCKLNAAVVPITPITAGETLQLVRSDSGATAYKSARYQYEGAETTEASITRVGGASDPTGQAQSRKIVTTANAQWLRPFRAEPYAIWNARTAANVVVTVCGTINAGAVPNNDDIWMDVEYLGSSATPLGTTVTTTKSNVLAANAAIASDGSTWNGGGSGAGWSPFKLTTTLSSPQPGLAGYIYARVRAAKPGTTFYIDPQITLS
jgi:hypothetical protein